MQFKLKSHFLCKTIQIYFKTNWNIDILSIDVGLERTHKHIVKVNLNWEWKRETWTQFCARKSIDVDGREYHHVSCVSE